MKGNNQFKFVAETSTPETAPQPESPSPEPAPESIAEPEPPSEPEVPEGAYNAEVIQPIGLVMREGPGTSFPQVGGVDYEAESHRPGRICRSALDASTGGCQRPGRLGKNGKHSPHRKLKSIFRAYVYQGQIGMNEFLRRKAPLLNLEWPLF